MAFPNKEGRKPGSSNTRYCKGWENKLGDKIIDKLGGIEAAAEWMIKNGDTKTVMAFLSKYVVKKVDVKTDIDGDLKIQWK